MSARDVIETLAILLAAGLVSEVVAGLLRIPRMVVLLAAGALLGPEVAGARGACRSTRSACSSCSRSASP